MDGGHPGDGPRRRQDIEAPADGAAVVVTDLRSAADLGDALAALPERAEAVLEGHPMSHDCFLGMPAQLPII